MFYIITRGCGSSAPPFNNGEAEHFYQIVQKNYYALAKDKNEPVVKQFTPLLATQLASIPNKSLTFNIQYKNIRLNSLCLQGINDAMSTVHCIVDLTLSHCNLADDAINVVSEMLKERKMLRKVFLFFYFF